jgi:hypothetical protein
MGLGEQDAHRDIGNRRIGNPKDMRLLTAQVPKLR